VKLRRFQCVLFALLLLVAAAYLAGALALALREDAIAVLKTAPERQFTVEHQARHIVPLHQLERHLGGPRRGN
jgi:hypothetical protein